MVPSAAGPAGRRPGRDVCPGGPGGRGGEEIADALKKASSVLPEGTDLAKRVARAVELLKEGDNKEALEDLRTIFEELLSDADVTRLEGLATDAAAIRASIGRLKAAGGDHTPADGETAGSDDEGLVRTGTKKGDDKPEAKPLEDIDTWDRGPIKDHVQRVIANPRLTPIEKAVVERYFPAVENNGG